MVNPLFKTSSYDFITVLIFILSNYSVCVYCCIRMGEIEHISQFAYFREFTHTHQFELHFNIDTVVPELGVFNEEIKAVRAIADTVSSLLQHIKNKILKILKEKYAESKGDDDSFNENLDIHVSLRTERRPIKGSMGLMAFRNNLLKDQFTIFKVFDQQYIVLPNAPLIKHMKLPPVIYANSCIQPFKFSALYTENHQSQFLWYKSIDKVKWTEVSRGFSYSTKDEDLGYYLKLICKPVSNIGIIGPPAEVISDCTVESMGELPRCPFEKRHQYTKDKLSDNNEFRVVTYNILAEKYANLDENYDYCEPKYLSIDYRKLLIAKELLGYNADIICLQEVDNRHYTNFFKDIFKERGYYSFYRRKGNKIPEGLVFMYDKAKFKHVEERHIVFSMEIHSRRIYAHLWELLKKNENLKNDFLRQSTSLQVCVLKVKDTNRLVIVANTHLYYHPDANHIRLLQATMATLCVSSMRRKHQTHGADVSVIFCGDFNSSHEKSLFPFMLQGSISPTHEDCLKISANGKALLYHEFNFESSCGKPKYTNYTPDYKGCLDYIFIERHKMTVEQVVPLIDEDELAEYVGLPNQVFPSDHLALVVDLKFKF